MSAAVLARWQRQADEFVPCQSGFLQFCWKSFPSLAHSEPCRVQANQISPPCLYRAATSRAEEKMGLRHLSSGAETLLVSAEISACLTNMKAPQPVGLILSAVPTTSSSLPLTDWYLKVHPSLGNSLPPGPVTQISALSS